MAGFVAQEVQKVLPEVVHLNPDGYLSLAYGNISALIVQALKEVIERLEILEKKIV